MSNWSIILENDLKWREAELTSLKKIAITAPNNSVIETAILRASWALLYAHFEGFTKFTWDLLLDQIEKENIIINELKDNYKILSLEKKFSELRGNMSSANLWNSFSQNLPSEILNKPKFEEDYRLKTESNLWPNIFERECQKIGISCTELDNQRARIKALVSRRNDIAHGKNMTIRSIREYNEYENATLLVMHELAISVLDLLENKLYLQKAQ